MAARQRAESWSTSHRENDDRRTDSSTWRPRPLVAAIISRFGAFGLHLLEPHHDEDWAHPHETRAHREDHHGSGPHERRMGHPVSCEPDTSQVQWCHARGDTQLCGESFSVRTNFVGGLVGLNPLPLTFLSSRAHWKQCFVTACIRWSRCKASLRRRKTPSCCIPGS